MGTAVVWHIRGKAWGKGKQGKKWWGVIPKSRLDWEAKESSRVKRRVFPLPEKCTVGDRRCLKEKRMSPPTEVALEDAVRVNGS